MHFAVNVANLWRTAPPAWPAQRVSDQVFRSATSVAANYHAACRARSRREFIAKLGLVIEEAEETVFWLEFAARVRLVEAGRTAPLVQEARELLAIFTASAKTASAGMPGRR